MILSLAVLLPQDGSPTQRGEKTHRPRSHERAANTAEEQLLLVINSHRLPESKGGYTCRPAVLHSYHLVDFRFGEWLDGCCKTLSSQDYIGKGTGWNGY